MKRTLCLSIIAFAFYASTSARAGDADKQNPAACGAGYPADFPCIPGGKPAQGVGELPNLKSMNVVHYKTAPNRLATQLEAKAKSRWMDARLARSRKRA